MEVQVPKSALDGAVISNPHPGLPFARIEKVDLKSLRPSDTVALQKMISEHKRSRSTNSLDMLPQGQL